MTGFAAYAGDILGRRMGKRRLSLFGLRPRYTAIVVTTITGMLIAILTIAVMISVSQAVRLLAIKGDKIIIESRQLEKKLVSTRKAYDNASRQLKEEKQAAVEARADADEARKQRDALAAEVAGITQKLNAVKADLQSSRAALALAERRLKQVELDYNTARKEVEQRRAEIVAQRGRISDLENRRAKLTEELKKNEAALALSEKHLKEAESAVANANQEIKKLDRMRQDLASELGAASERWPRYIALREQKIIFRPGDDLSRRVIMCNQPKPDIRQQVLAMLNDADKQARVQGAKPSDRGRAIEIMPKKVEGEGGFLDEDESIDAITDNIATESGSVLLRVYSLSNSAKDEPVLVEIQLIRNIPIYSAGQEVASAQIDGQLSRGEIFGNLVGFLRNDVRDAAIKGGIIPTTENGEPSIGEMPGDQVFDLIDRIKAAGKPVRVRARAAKETWSAGPLRLELDVDSQ